jgi:hypothetical protein
LESTLNLGENIFWNQPLTEKNILESTPKKYFGINPQKKFLNQALTFENIWNQP